MRQLRIVDHTFAELISSWIARRQAAGHHVIIEPAVPSRYRVVALEAAACRTKGIGYRV